MWRSGEPHDPSRPVPGWADIYPWDFSGQYIDVTGVPAGEYLLCVTADPAKRFRQVSTSNDEAVGESPDDECQGRPSGDEAGLLFPERARRAPGPSVASAATDGLGDAGWQAIAVRSPAAQSGVARSTASFLCRLPGQRSA